MFYAVSSLGRNFVLLTSLLDGQYFPVVLQHIRLHDALLGGHGAARYRGGSSWKKPIRKTCSWGDSSLTLWSKSNGWATAGDHGIGIEQSGNTSSNFPTRRTWETNFQRIWWHAFWRSIASGMIRWMGGAVAGVGMWRSA